MMENPLQLSYSFPTQPSPLGAGDAIGRLNVVVSNHGEPRYCSRLTIFLPIGKGADYLSTAVPIASVNTTRWTIGTAPQSAGDYLPPHLSGLNVDFMAFHCRPATPEDEQIGDDLEFRFVIEGVDASPGHFPIGITEHVAEEKHANPSPRSGSFYRRKAEPQFFLRNLVASAAHGDVNVPLGRIAAGTPFRLDWEGNGTSYRIYTQGSIPLYTGEDTQFLLKEGIQADTTFVLQAQVPGNQAGGSGFEAEYLYAALTICCSDADLHVKSLSNATTIHSVGDISTQGALSAAGTATVGSLEVTGDTKLAEVWAMAGLHVKGETSSTVMTAERAFITQIKGDKISAIALDTDKIKAVTLDANQIDAAALNVKGSLVAEYATVQLFSPPVLIHQSSNFSGTENFLVETDGIVLCYAYVKEPILATEYHAYVLVHPPKGSQVNFYQGGASLSSKATEASISVPVRKGDKFGIQFWGDGFGKKTTALASFYFFGLGAGGVKHLGNS